MTQNRSIFVIYKVIKHVPRTSQVMLSDIIPLKYKTSGYIGKSLLERCECLDPLCDVIPLSVAIITFALIPYCRRLIIPTRISSVFKYVSNGQALRKNVTKFGWNVILTCSLPNKNIVTLNVRAPSYVSLSRSIRVADDLAPCVARASTAMIFTT